MGEDFLRRTERSYRRSLQRTVAQRLITPPLFQQPENTATTYPCRLTQPEEPMTTSGTLLLHRRNDGGIEILDQHRIIGTVDGEPREDLNDYLNAIPGAADILPVQAVRNDGAYLEFTIAEEGAH